LRTWRRAPLSPVMQPGQWQTPPGKSCGLKGSTQRLREVYSRGSQKPKFFAGVDLDAARSCPVRIAYSRKGRCSWAGIVAASGWCFRSCCAAQGYADHRIEFHIRSHREGLVFGHLQPAVPGQRAPQGRGSTSSPAKNLPREWSSNLLSPYRWKLPRVPKFLYTRSQQGAACRRETTRRHYAYGYSCRFRKD
jgi:hypothetical protein